jgi:L-asparagine transporter-like permease
MSDFDLDRLGDVWRQQPDPAEMERLQRSAAAVSRRARLSQIVDVVAAIAVAGVVIVLVLSNPRSEAFVMGAAAILVLLYSNIRSRKLRQIELRSLTGSTENMLQQSVERIETTLRHNRFVLLAIGPALAVGLLFGAAAIGNRAGAMFPAVHDVPQIRILVRVVSVAALGGFVLFLLLAMRRGRRELERLKAMRESYREERESSAP